MAITLGGSSAVTSGLLISFDASKTASYPGTGTTWTDLSGNGNTGTFVGGISYSADNRGSLVFNGSTGYVQTNNTLSTITSEFTVSCFIKSGVAQGGLSDIWGNHNGTYTGICFQQNNNAERPDEFSVLFGNGSSWQGWQTLVFKIPVGIWCYLTVVKTTSSLTVYNGNTQIATLATTGNVATSTAGFMVGLGYPGLPRNWGGSMSNIQVYNRALTVSEISQNCMYFCQGVLLSDSSIQVTKYDSANETGGIINITSFTGTGTWTKPAGCTSVLVKMVGGGGGAAGYCESGGGGGYTEKVVDVTAVATVAVTVGAGGASVNYYASGNGGGTSSFGSYCSASGGSGANVGGSHCGGTSGVGSGGNINLYGGIGTGHSNHAGNFPSGQGGGTFFGSSGTVNRATTSNKLYSGAPGTGGPGGRTDDGGSSANIANGETGLVIVYAYK